MNWIVIIIIIIIIIIRFPYINQTEVIFFLTTKAESTRLEVIHLSSTYVVNDLV